MMRDPIALLAYEAKRRPELAGLVHRIDDIADDDLKTVPLPLPWMRDALIQLKAKRQIERTALCVEEWVIAGYTPDPMGTVRRWIGENCFIRVGRSELLINAGQLLWLDRNELWIDTIRATVIDPRIASHTVIHGQFSRSAYNKMVRGGRETLTVSAPHADAKPAFSLFRPA